MWKAELYIYILYNFYKTGKLWGAAAVKTARSKLRGSMRYLLLLLTIIY